MNRLLPIPAKFRDQAAYRQIIEVAWPLWLASITSNVLGAIGIAIVGRSSETGFAAVAAGAAIFSLLSNLILAASIGHQILSSKRYGATDARGAASSFYHSLVFAGCLALAASIVVSVAALSLTRWVGGSDDVAQEAAKYVRFRAPELLLLVVFTLLRSTINAQKKTRLSMYASVVLTAASIPIDYVFIYGTPFTPALGAPGAGLGASCSMAIGVLFLVELARRHGILNDLKPSGLKLNRSELGVVSNLSVPMIVSSGMDYAGTLLLVSFVGTLGEASLGGHRIAFQVMFLLYGAIGSISGGAQILISRSWGAEDLASAEEFGHRSRHLMVVLACLLAIPVVAWPSSIVHLFTGFDDVETATIGAIRAVGVSLPFMAVALNNVGILRGLGRTKLDMITNISSVWLVQIPLAFILGKLAGWNLTGVYVGFSLYWVARALIGECLVRRIVLQERHVDEDEQQSSPGLLVGVPSQEAALGGTP